RGRAAIDQYDERLALAQIPGPGIEPLRLLGIAPARRDDFPLLQEGIGNRDRLIEEAARIVAQIDDEALELVARLRREIGDRLLQAVRGLLVELGDAAEPDVIAFQPRAHGAHADDVAGDLHFDRLVPTLAHDL